MNTSSKKTTPLWQPLCRGDIVDIVAPASASTKEGLEEAIGFVERWGLHPRWPADIFGPDELCANSDQKRFEHLKKALQAKDSQILWSLRGGWGSARLMPMLTTLKSTTPTKIFIGYSDMTTLHMFFNDAWKWPTLHSSMLYELSTEEGRQQESTELRKLLFGFTSSLEYKNLKPLNKLARQEKIIHAPIVGGNLTVLQSSLGTPWQVLPKGKILALEDVNEEAYRVDRMLFQLEQAGFFKDVCAIIFGSFTGGKEKNSSLLWKVIKNRFAKEASVPILKDLPFGHAPQRRPLPLLTTAQLQLGPSCALHVQVPISSESYSHNKVPLWAEESPPPLKKGASVHFMGICGTAMASLAGLFLEQGFRVTGSDQNVYPPMSTQLENLGISIMEGYKASNLDHNPDLVIVGNVISKDFEEAQALLKSKIPYTSLPKALGKFIIADRHSVVISGTHGKTTTTAMMSWVAEVQGRRPGFLIGGIPHNFEKSFRPPQGNWFVIEGDEYDTAFFDKNPKFIYYHPQYVILTSIEFDHADIYSNLDDIKLAFKELIQRIPMDGLLVANSDDPHVMDIAQNHPRLVTFGLHSGDYRARCRKALLGRNQLAVEYKGQSLGDLAIKLFGKHNTMNALATLALSLELGWKKSKVLQALADFKGVKRRQEVIGEFNGITVIEDFAHHPTAVQLTIEAMREGYPQRRLISIFEPRSTTSRRKIFQDDYAKALQDSDLVIIPQVTDFHRVPKSERFSSAQLVKDLNREGTFSVLKEDAQSIVEFLTHEVNPGDVVLIMSNGGFDDIYTQLNKALA